MFFQLLTCGEEKHLDMVNGGKIISSPAVCIQAPTHSELVRLSAVDWSDKEVNASVNLTGTATCFFSHVALGFYCKDHRTKAAK